MAKGAQYERDICTQLSMWWTNNARDEVFWRSSNSGGRATVRAKKGKSTCSHNGDITYTDPIGKPLIDAITFECKRGYAKSTIHDLLDYPSTAKLQTYEEWFNQVIDASIRAGSISWALISRRDRRSPMIFVPNSLWLKFPGACSSESVRLRVPCRNGDMSVRHLQIVGMPLDTFFTKVSPDWIRELVRDVEVENEQHVQRSDG